MLLAMAFLTLLTMFLIWIPFGSRQASALYVAAFFMGIGTGSFVPLSGSFFFLHLSRRETFRLEAMGNE